MYSTEHERHAGINQDFASLPQTKCFDLFSTLIQHPRHSTTTANI
jgi:hypothetical protein